MIRPDAAVRPALEARGAAWHGLAHLWQLGRGRRDAAAPAAAPVRPRPVRCPRQPRDEPAPGRWRSAGGRGAAELQGEMPRCSGRVLSDAEPAAVCRKPGGPGRRNAPHTQHGAACRRRRGRATDGISAENWGHGPLRGEEGLRPVHRRAGPPAGPGCRFPCGAGRRRRGTRGTRAARGRAAVCGMW